MVWKTPYQESKDKISKANKGRVFSEEHRKKLSESHKGEKNHNFGKPKTEDFKNKVGAANGSPVICLETLDVYGSTGIAARAVGLKRASSIYDVCRGRRKSSGGYHWMYLKDYEGEIKNLNGE